jgi:glycosyltransferase involved in cell wall biosynthesis
MLKNKNIVIFANDWIADNKTSSHQIASILGRENRVLFIETGGMRAPTATAHDFKRIFQKIKKGFSGAKKVHGEYLDFKVASLLIIPFHRFSIVRYFNRVFITLTMRYLLWHYKFSKPIIFYFSPHIHYLCGNLGEHIKIFYCIDNYSAFPGADPEEVQKMDIDLTIKSDIVFVVSRNVIVSKEKFNKRVYYSPHGVDIENFNLKGKKFIKPKLLDFAENRPIVMYWGLIADWMDFDLVNYLVDNHRDIAFFLIGRICTNPNLLISKENLSCPGPLPYSDLSKYAFFSSALIIPFLINDWTKNINPLKLKEYLATGKPIISSAIPESLRNEEFIKIAKSKNSFSESLFDIIQNPSKEREQKQLDYIKKLTWENRVIEICGKIEDLDRKI